MSIDTKKRELLVEVEEADALGFGCVSKGYTEKFDVIPFKFNELGADEIRMKVLYTSLCHSDLAYSTGKWSDDIILPCVPGHEFVGEILSVGEGVNHLRVKDIVGYGILEKPCGECTYCIGGSENLCKTSEDVMVWYPGFGGWATHWQGKAKYAQRIPAGIPLELVGPILDAGLTVYAPLIRNMKPEHKELAVIGIGGLGHMAIKYGKALGMRVTAITTSIEKSEDILEIGADAVYTYDTIEELTEARKIDIAICCFSEGNIDPYMKLLKQRGIFIIVSCPDRGKEFLGIDTLFLVQNEISIVGSLFGSFNELQQCLEFSAVNKIFPNIELYDFDDFTFAVHKLARGKPKFRCVVKCLSNKYPKFNNR